MVFENRQEGILLRVRLTPNSSSCKKSDVFVDSSGCEFLKINVISVPEKGKANQELLAYLSKQLHVSKSSFEIVSGEADRYKKILVKGDTADLQNKIQQWLEG